MQFTTTLVAALTIMMAPAAVLGENELTYRNARHADCSSNKVGPERKLSAGVCHALADTDHAIKVVSLAGKCKGMFFSLSSHFLSLFLPVLQPLPLDGWMDAWMDR
jgi:hypothetical protein